YRCPHGPDQFASQRRHCRGSGDGQPARRGGHRAGPPRRPRLQGRARSGQSAGRSGASRHRQSRCPACRAAGAHRAGQQAGRAGAGGADLRGTGRRTLPAAGQDRRGHRRAGAAIHLQSPAKPGQLCRGAGQRHCRRQADSRARGAATALLRGVDAAEPRRGTGRDQPVAHLHHRAGRRPRDAPLDREGRLRRSRAGADDVRAARGMGDGQFQGNAARSDAAGTARRHRDRRLSRPNVRRPRRQYPSRQRHGVQPAAGRERDRQLRQDRSARAGQDRVRQSARRRARTRHIGGADGEGAMSDPPRSGGWSASRSAAGDRNPWLVAVVVSIATFMVVLDTAIANVSLRYIAGSFGASIDESTWVLTTYLIANAVVLPASGWLSNVIGRKRFYMLCVAMFTVSSLFCGLAPSLGALIFFRILQGLGGGGMPTSEQAILADTFPPEKRGQAFALYGIAVIVAPTVGPTLGGWITDNYSWHWIFFINVPIGIISLVLVQWLVVEPEVLERERHERLAGGLKVDWIGFALIALTFGSLEIVLDRGQIEDWFHSTFIITFATISACSFIFFIPWELTHDDPIVDIRLLFRRQFGMSFLVMLAVGAILFGSNQITPQ